MCDRGLHGCEYLIGCEWFPRHALLKHRIWSLKTRAADKAHNILRTNTQCQDCIDFLSGFAAASCCASAMHSVLHGSAIEAAASLEKLLDDLEGTTNDRRSRSQIAPAVFWQAINFLGNVSPKSHFHIRCVWENKKPCIRYAHLNTVKLAEVQKPKTWKDIQTLSNSIGMSLVVREMTQRCKGVWQLNAAAGSKQKGWECKDQRKCRSRKESMVLHSSHACLSGQHFTA